MELFKFNPIVGGTTVFERGDIITGATSVMWVERYRDFGEFEIKAPVSSNLKNLLPLNSFISHVATTEIMIVENQEISENYDSEPEIIITGRSLETCLEQRIVGTNQTYTGVGLPLLQYEIPAERIWYQAIYLINEHILASILLNDNYAFANLQTTAQNVNMAYDSTEVIRVVKRSPVYDSVLELLAVDDLGIKTVRPGPWSPLTTGGLTDTALVIHKGLDLTKSVTFSYSSGDITNAQYLFSTKNLKTDVFVASKWLEMPVQGGTTSYNKRVLFVDAPYLDNDYSSIPTGSDRTAITGKMITLGRQALKNRNLVTINRAEVSKESTRYVYRQDYNVGDLVAVEGNYDASTVMRVTEYVEIEDESGEYSYPTLSAI